LAVFIETSGIGTAAVPFEWWWERRIGGVGTGAGSAAAGWNDDLR